MTRAYASGTTVSVEKTRALGQTAASANVLFSLGGLQYRLEVPLPSAAPEKGDEPRGWWGWGTSQREAWIVKESAQLHRERWRSLLLLLKAKLEAVRCGVSTVQKEFLADLILQDGHTVEQALSARIHEAINGRKFLALPAAGEP